ncbi:dioxygenase [Myxococcota bacterium]|nr:dioxygenase [Myxococcota bacterium]
MTRRPSHSLDRRSLLRLGGVVLVGSAAACAGRTRDGDTAALTGDGGGAGSCPPTDENIEGPFYREGAPARTDLVEPGDSGTRLSLAIQVVDLDCRALAGAEIDLWQADPGGEYDNSSAAMRYRGIGTTDADGRVRFTTMVPGYYLNGSQFRPAHLHLMVRVAGVHRLTTQLYFEGDPYLDADPFVEDAPVMAVVEDEEGSWACEVRIAV